MTRMGHEINIVEE